MRQLMIPLQLLAVAGLALGCDSYDRVNPVDPGAEARLTLTAPDTVDLYRSFRLQVTWSPATSYLPTVTADPADMVQSFRFESDAPGRAFIVPTLQFTGPVQITTRVGRSSATRDMFVTVTPGTIAVRRCSSDLVRVGTAERLEAIAYGSGTGILMRTGCAGRPSAVQWSNSDTTVAVVMDDLVMGISQGYALITARIGTVQGQIGVNVYPR